MVKALFVASLLIAAASFYVYTALDDRKYSSTPVDGEYDYIVVGAGSSGATVAYRLAEQKYRVLLLEAGGEDVFFGLHVPGLSSLLASVPWLTWAFQTTPQQHTYNRVHNWPRGKVLGGSSSLNAMLFIRGNAHDYNRWAHDFGCDGWAFDDVLPYFKRLEDHHLATEAPELHSAGGPTPATLGALHPGTKAFLQAAENAGLRLGNNPNVKDPEGVYQSHFFVKDARRASTAQTYVRLALQHFADYFTLRTHAQVTRVVLSDKNEATGVAFVDHDGGKEIVVHAKREVILSAGAVQSPHLLMLSGLGDCEELRAVGLPCRHHLPGVGKNLQDHIMIYETFFTKDEFGLSSSVASLFSTLIQYYLSKEGPFASSIVQAMVFHRTDPNLAVPDVQIMFVPSAGEATVVSSFGLPYEAGPTSVGHTPMPALLHPKSIGRLYINSSNPLDKPIIDPHYLEHPDDVRVLMDGVKLVHKIYKHSPMAEVLLPGAAPLRWKQITSTQSVDSDEYIEELVRRYAITVFHPVGTCKMGPESDESTVVDPQLRVKGVKNLRVVDASVMPEIPSGNTHIPSVMIGEKAADMIGKAR